MQVDEEVKHDYREDGFSDTEIEHEKKDEKESELEVKLHFLTPEDFGAFKGTVLIITGKLAKTMVEIAFGETWTEFAHLKSESVKEEKEMKEEHHETNRHH